MGLRGFARTTPGTADTALSQVFGLNQSGGSITTIHLSPSSGSTVDYLHFSVSNTNSVAKYGVALYTGGSTATMTQIGFWDIIQGGQPIALLEGVPVAPGWNLYAQTTAPNNTTLLGYGFADRETNS